MSDPASTEIKRAEGGRFAKGSSACPGGPWRSGKLKKARRALEKLDDKALQALAELLDDTDPKVRAVAVQTWAKYRLPVPKDTTNSNVNITSTEPVIPPDIRARLARMQ